MRRCSISQYIKLCVLCISTEMNSNCKPLASYRVVTALYINVELLCYCEDETKQKKECGGELTKSIRRNTVYFNALKMPSTRMQPHNK